MIEQTKLSRLINRHSAHEGRNSTIIAGLHLAKAYKAGFAVPRIYEPCLCIIAQGQRLVRLPDNPQDIAPLAPLIFSEIYYRLLQGEHGAYLAQLAQPESRAGQIARVANYIKNSLNRSIKMEDLARLANMSPPSFYNHFKQITAMSPLQYQKRLRLTKARRLMLNDTINAAAAAYQVGYESVPQFNREYSHLFGAPPGQDIARMKTDI